MKTSAVYCWKWGYSCFGKNVEMTDERTWFWQHRKGQDFHLSQSDTRDNSAVRSASALSSGMVRSCSVGLWLKPVQRGRGKSSAHGKTEVQLGRPLMKKRKRISWQQAIRLSIAVIRYRRLPVAVAVYECCCRRTGNMKWRHNRRVSDHMREIEKLKFYARLCQISLIGVYLKDR